MGIFGRKGGIILPTTGAILKDAIYTLNHNQYTVLFLQSSIIQRPRYKEMEVEVAPSLNDLLGVYSLPNPKTLLIPMII